MVLGYHIIMTAYGRWLPNDPRGSSSHVIRNDVLADFGELHHGRKRLQPAARDIRAFYARASEVLKHDALEFSAADRATIGDAFHEAIKKNFYTCYQIIFAIHSA